MAMLSSLWFLSLSAVLLLLHVTNARLNSTLNFHIPAQLHKDGGYDHEMGLFGRVMMGHGAHTYGSMALHVYQAGSDLCKIVNPTPGREHPFTFFTQRGNCSSVTKARHAQMAGAAGLIEAQNHCLCSDGDACKSKEPCQPEQTPLHDDGSGSDVSIPVVLMKLQDATAVEAQLNEKDASVVMDLKWEPRQIMPNEPMYYGVDVDLYDRHTADLLQQIKPLALALSERARFYPTFAFYNGTSMQCVGKTAKDQQCPNICTNNGRYCYPSQHVPGGIVVKEILNRLCIWKHFGQKDDKDVKGPNDGAAWWDYVTYFDQNCPFTWKDNVFDESALDKCTEKAYEHAKINKADVDSCIEDTGGLSDDHPNSILEEQLKMKHDYGINVAPIVWADGRVLHWFEPSASSVIKEVCYGYLFGDSKMPQVCKDCGRLEFSHDVDKCLTEKYGSHKKKKHHRFRNFMWFLLVLGILAGIGYVNKKRQEGMRLSSMTDGLRYAFLSDQNQEPTQLA